MADLPRVFIKSTLVEEERCDFTVEYLKTGSTSEWKLVIGYRMLAREFYIVNGGFSDLRCQINTLTQHRCLSLNPSLDLHRLGWKRGKHRRETTGKKWSKLCSKSWKVEQSPFPFCNFKPSIRVKLWQATWPWKQQHKTRWNGQKWHTVVWKDGLNTDRDAAYFQNVKWPYLKFRLGHASVVDLDL